MIGDYVIDARCVAALRPPATPAPASSRSGSRADSTIPTRVSSNSAAGGWAAGGTKVKGVTEFSHWIPRRYLKKTGSSFIEKTFGLSKWNGNYVTHIRHAMHDPFRMKFMDKALWSDAYPSWLQQLDRVPHVCYGVIGGGVYGISSLLIGGVKK